MPESDCCSPEKDGLTMLPGGIISRPGFYRPSNPDTSAYTMKVRRGDNEANCPFCPEADKTILDEDEYFLTIRATSPYAHFDAQEVVEHNLLIPRTHVESLRQLGKKALRRWLNITLAFEANTPEGTGAVCYTRSPNNPSRSVRHLHTHLLTLSSAAVHSFSYDIHNGATDLSFIMPTDEQIAQLGQHKRALQ